MDSSVYFNHGIGLSMLGSWNIIRSFKLGSKKLLTTVSRDTPYQTMPNLYDRKYPPPHRQCSEGEQGHCTELLWIWKKKQMWVESAELH